MPSRHRTAERPSVWPIASARAFLSMMCFLLMTLHLIAPPIDALDTAAQASADETLIVIDVDGQTLTLYVNHEEKARFRVATGTRGTPSPIGIWKIKNKAVNWGTGFGTRWMGITANWGQYGIHGTNKPGSIGSGASHGCIRMLNSDVEKLYPMVPIGATVLIEGFRGSGIDTYAAVPGDRGAFIKHVQQRLKNNGYDPGGVDGVYGEGMKRALLRFKKDHNLGNSHVIDAQTIYALGVLAFE